MANTKKYVSLDKLGLYDEKIKGVITAGDSAALDSAKEYAKNYADGLAVNYEAAGSIATAKTEIQGKIDAVEAKADTAQSEVDALELLVGTLPTGTDATSVIDYVNKKTAGIATEGAMTELGNRVTVVEGDVATIKGDYLKGSDKTELSDLITAEKNRAEGIEGGLRTDVDAIKADYLKGSDKTELQGAIDDVVADVAAISGDYLKGSDKTELEGKINAKVAQSDYDAKMEEIGGDIDGLQTQINTIMNNPDAEGAINSINEFTQYVADHGTIADGFRNDIDKNKDDIAAEVKRAGEAETELSGRLDVLEAIDHNAYVGADTALKNELNGEIAKKADATVVSDMDTAYKAADTALDNRLKLVEAAVGESGSVADDIETAKNAAIEAAAADATSKANAAEAAAKGYTDTEIDKVEETIATLQGVVATKAAASDLTALAGRVETAEGEIDTLQSEMDAVEALAAANKAAHEANAAAIALKADATALTAVGDRVTAIETWHANFVEVSEEEINGLFA